MRRARYAASLVGFLKNGGRGQDEVGREEAEVLVVVGRGGAQLSDNIVAARLQ